MKSLHYKTKSVLLYSKLQFVVLSSVLSFKNCALHCSKMLNTIFIQSTFSCVQKFSFLSSLNRSSRIIIANKIKLFFYLLIIVSIRMCISFVMHQFFFKTSFVNLAFLKNSNFVLLRNIFIVLFFNSYSSVKCV